MLGIVGGMGPQATADFMLKLIMETPATRDQDHIPTLVANIPQIPDRTSAILGIGSSPINKLIECARMLERSGSTALAIPCNTAHYWFDELQNSVDIPILHIVDTVISELRSESITTPVTLLATQGTIKSGIYQKKFSEENMQLRIPDDEFDMTAHCITLAKGGDLSRGQKMFSQLLGRLRDKGHESVILGCTELPLLTTRSDLQIIDSTYCLARACVARFLRK